MTTKSDGLSDLPLRDLCRVLAARTPTPSGGSMAAAVGALGAAGVSMTLRFAESEGGQGPGWQAGRADELETAAGRLCDLVDRDASIYDRVVAARGIPDGPERDLALSKALRAALDTPFEMIEACVGALRLAAIGAPRGVPPHLACDSLAGAEALRAALECAFLMVRENASGAGDAEEARAILEAATALRAEADALCARMREHVAR